MLDFKNRLTLESCKFGSSMNIELWFYQKDFGDRMM